MAAGEDVTHLFSPLSRELAAKHSILIVEVSNYERIAPEPVVREACKLHDLNFQYWAIRQSLLFSEATTAAGLAWWIGIHEMGLTPKAVQRKPWYRRLAAEVA